MELKDPLTYEQRRKFDYYFLEAVRMKQKGEYDAAFQLYSHCLDIYPGSAAVLYEISQFYMFLGQEAKGEEALKQAVRSDDTNFWYKQTLASYYQSKQNWLKAISVYEDMAQIFPSRLEPLLSLADLYSRTKSYESLVTTLDRIEELDGKSEQISMEKFRAYLQLDNMEKAFSEIQSLVDEYPYDMRYRTVLGDVYLSNERNEEALKVYQDILKEEPDYAPAMVSLASYYQKTGQDSLYDMQIDSILVNENVDTKLKLDFMRQLIMKSEQTDRDSTKIIRLFETILTRKQPNADVPMLYAQYLITKKMEKESVPVLNKVLSLDPENKPARLQLLGYAIRDNNLDEVIRVATPATVYNPDAMEFYYYLGLAHYQKDETDKALEVFNKGVQQINEKSDKNIASDFYSILGDLYHSREMKAEAYAAYDSSLVYNPNNINTLNNYAYYLSVERTNLDKAEEMSFITVKAEPENSTYLDTYAWILFEKGRYTEARIYIEQAMENGGDSSQVIVEHCGDIYYKLGEKDKALELWKKALNLEASPDDGSTPRSRNTLRNTMIGGLSGTEYMEKVIEWTPSRQNLTARTRLELNTGSASPISVNANMRIRRGEIIRITVAPFLGIEVARIDITPEKVLAIDRMNKQYVELGFGELSSMLNTELDFNILQSLILNEIFIPGREKLSESDAEKFNLSPYGNQAKLQVKGTKRIGYSFFTSATDGRLEETVISLKGLPYSLHCRYADFTVLGNDVFPQSVEMQSEGTDKTYSLSMKLSRIRTDSDWDAKSEISSKYRKISIQELLQLIIKQ